MEIKTSKEHLWHMQHMLFRHGLTGGGSITPVQLNGVNVSKDFHYLYKNTNICVRFFYKRCASGVWYDLTRIEIENMTTRKLFIFSEV